MVDLLDHAGNLQEAENAIKGMPHKLHECVEGFAQCLQDSW
jgi:hypothetical protein